MEKERRASPARRVALDALVAVEGQGAYAPQALGGRLERSGLSPRDRRLATELVYGVTRWRGRIDYSLHLYSKRPLERLTPCVRNALRLAAYQALFLRAVPGPVACSESVLLVKEREPWAAGYVNAVCRSLLREGEAPLPDPERAPAEHLAARHSHPLWLVDRWLARLGFDQTAALVEANNAAAAVTLRVNALRARPEEVEAELAARGIRVERGSLSPSALRIEGAGAVDELPGFAQGRFQVQDEGSQLVAWAVDPPAGGAVADVCAGPGGKATHLAELAALRGESEGPRVWAFDVHPHRVELVIESARRLGVEKFVAAEVADARNLGALGLPPFDRVLVDAPCTGTGVLRRRPDLRWRRTPADLDALVTLQRELLVEAARLTKVGGALVYSTCSLEEEENIQNAAWFLETHPGFRPSPVAAHLPAPAQAALAEHRFALEGSALQLWPHLDGTDGMFIFRAVREA